MAKTKFYVKGNFAEDRAYGIVELTNAEVTAVRKFVDTETFFGGDYCGNSGISSKGYDTYDEAYDYMIEIANGKANFN